MTTHGEFLHKAITDAGWKFFDKVGSYSEFVEQEKDIKQEPQAASSSEALLMVKAIKSDYRQAPLNRKDRTMLDFTRKLAIARRELGRADYESLRASGFREHEILDIILVAALAEFANCLAEAIGMRPGESLRAILFGGADEPAGLR
jgi:hypothetical protein